MAPIWSNMEANEFRNWMNSPEVIANLPTETPPLNQRFFGAMTGHLNQICIGDENRKLFLAYVFGVTSSKHLTPKQWAAIWAFLAPIKDETTGQYRVWPHAPGMALKVIRAQYKLLGQEEMEADAEQIDIYG